MIRASPKGVLTKARCSCPAKPVIRCRPGPAPQSAMTLNINGKVPPICFCLASWRGWRHGNVTKQRTKQDFAQPMRLLLDQYFPTAERIRLVVDNLNTHTPAALDGAFLPAEARRSTRKLEFHYTPQQGSWLNMAEGALAVLAGQCLERRISTIASLREEIAAWEGPRNQRQTKIPWPFGTDVARVKLKRL